MNICGGNELSRERDEAAVDGPSLESHTPSTAQIRLRAVALAALGEGSRKSHCGRSHNDRYSALAEIAGRPSSEERFLVGRTGVTGTAGCVVWRLRVLHKSGSLINVIVHG